MEERTMRRMMATMLMFVALGLAPRGTRADDAPALSGTIELEEGTVGVGIGFSWGKGTLTYQGKTYPITASGFDVGDVGVARVRATGKVYNMTDLASFDGQYKGFVGGATLVAGGEAVSMVNGNAVHIELVSTTEGVKLILAGDTVTLKIKK
jgi:hypothetical protein